MVGIIDARQHEQIIDDSLSSRSNTLQSLFFSASAQRHSLLITQCEAEVSGVRGSPARMTNLLAKDSLNDRWTYHWTTTDEYSRIDYIFVSPGLGPEVRRDTATIYRSSDWEKASDHRPVFVTIAPQEKSK